MSDKVNRRKKLHFTSLHSFIDTVFVFFSYENLFKRKNSFIEWWFLFLLHFIICLYTETSNWNKDALPLLEKFGLVILAFCSPFTISSFCKETHSPIHIYVNGEIAAMIRREKHESALHCQYNISTFCFCIVLV